MSRGDRRPQKRNHKRDRGAQRKMRQPAGSFGRILEDAGWLSLETRMHAFVHVNPGSAYYGIELRPGDVGVSDLSTAECTVTQWPEALAAYDRLTA